MDKVLVNFEQYTQADWNTSRNFELTSLQARDITRDCEGPAPYYHPHFKVHLENRKGWQCKQGNDGPLQSMWLLLCH